MKKQNTRAMTGEEKDVKAAAEVINKVPVSGGPKVLRCTRDADMPFIGAFKSGQLIEDQRTVALIADNPNFEEVQGGKS